MPMPTINKVLNTVELEELGLYRDVLLDQLVRTPFGSLSARQTETEIANLEQKYWTILNDIDPTLVVDVNGNKVPIGQIIKEDKDPLWAATILKSMRENGHTHPSVDNNLGIVYLWLGEFEAARRAFQRAVKHRPGLPGTSTLTGGSDTNTTAGPATDEQGVAHLTSQSHQTESKGDQDDTDAVLNAPEFAAKDNLEHLKRLIEILVSLSQAKRNLSLTY